MMCVYLIFVVGVEWDFCKLCVLVSVPHRIAHRNFEELEEGSFRGVTDDASVHHRKSKLIQIKFGSAAQTYAVHQGFPTRQSFVT